MHNYMYIYECKDITVFIVIYNFLPNTHTHTKVTLIKHTDILCDVVIQNITPNTVNQYIVKMFFCFFLSTYSLSVA